MESILTSIKKLLNIAEEDESFDSDVIMHINSVFMILTQMGVGPSTGFSIKDKTADWSDFIPSDKNIEGVKTYVYMKVALIFDTPTGAKLEAFKEAIKEYESRLNWACDNGGVS